MCVTHAHFSWLTKSEVGGSQLVKKQRHHREPGYYRWECFQSELSAKHRSTSRPRPHSQQPRQRGSGRPPLSRAKESKTTSHDTGSGRKRVKWYPVLQETAGRWRALSQCAQTGQTMGAELRKEGTGGHIKHLPMHPQVGILLENTALHNDLFPNGTQRPVAKTKLSGNRKAFLKCSYRYLKYQGGHSGKYMNV